MLIMLPVPELRTYNVLHKKSLIYNFICATSYTISTRPGPRMKLPVSDTGKAGKGLLLSVAIPTEAPF